MGSPSPPIISERKLALELYTKVHLTEIESFFTPDGNLQTETLKEFSLQAQKLAHRLSDAVSHRYFQYREQSQQMEDLGA